MLSPPSQHMRLATRRYQEKWYFTPGDTGFRVFKTKFATIGVLICWDQVRCTSLYTPCRQKSSCPEPAQIPALTFTSSPDVDLLINDHHECPGAVVP